MMVTTRGAAREAAILESTQELLIEQGYERLTVDAVAAHARASKATIYARWPDKASLVAAALKSRSAGQPRIATSGTSLRDDVLAFLELCVHIAETESLAAFMSVLGAARDDRVLAEAVRSTGLAPRRQECWDMVQRAIGRGEITQPELAEQIFDLVMGKILVRYVVEDSPLSENERVTFVDRIVLPALLLDAVRE